MDGRIVRAKNQTRAEKVKALTPEGKKKSCQHGQHNVIDSAGLGTLVSAHHSAKRRARPCVCAIWDQVPKCCKSPSCDDDF